MCRRKSRKKGAGLRSQNDDDRREWRVKCLRSEGEGLAPGHVILGLGEARLLPSSRIGILGFKAESVLPFTVSSRYTDGVSLDMILDVLGRWHGVRVTADVLATKRKGEPVSATSPQLHIRRSHLLANNLIDADIVDEHHCRRDQLLPVDSLERRRYAQVENDGLSATVGSDPASSKASARPLSMRN